MERDSTMNNEKTGLLIRQLRKEKGMTQKELAQQLHITDRAVSKWERGLCAPDLSLLEPLAGALGCSILELIEGERAAPAEYTPETEEGAKRALAYSIGEAARKIRAVRKQYLGCIALCLAAAAVLCALALWHSGALFVIDRIPSPDGTGCITVYSKQLYRSAFPTEDGTSLIVQGSGDGQYRTDYGKCSYRGAWWAPNSKRYVVCLDYQGNPRLVLSDLELNSELNLSAYLSTGVQAAELSTNGYNYAGIFPDIEYQFLQWGLDSQSILICYSFQDPQTELHEGYFWYNCDTGAVSAVLPLSP